MTRVAKKKVIKDVLGEQISSQTLTFLMLLVDRNRISILDVIAKRFLELSYKKDSIEIAKVTSSVPLSDRKIRKKEKKGRTKKKRNNKKNESREVTKKDESKKKTRKKKQEKKKEIET